ncbi:MAG: four helix bundle protein [Patescibacteria group bacterium]
MSTSNQQPNSNIQKFDLLDRTAKVGEDVIEFCQNIKGSVITNPLISQIVRSGTSIGANYAEANEANSKKDFQNKIAIAKKEAKETLHWLRMIVKADPNKRDWAAKIYKEVHELILIFAAILKK